MKVPIGQSPLNDAFNRALIAIQPTAALRYEDLRKRTLAAFCRELHAASTPNPFYLSCRSVGSLFGISHQQANSWLFLLCEDRILTVDTPGTS